VTDLPFVQDDGTADVWGGWGAAWRDVWVLDRDNAVHAVFNLSDRPLEDPENYAALYALFVEAGGGG
jgi:hypothetical protein